MTIFVGPVDHVGRPLRCQNAPGCQNGVAQQNGPGRVRLYCSDRCRFAAWAEKCREPRAKTSAEAATK